MVATVAMVTSVAAAEELVLVVLWTGERDGWTWSRLWWRWRRSGSISAQARAIRQEKEVGVAVRAVARVVENIPLL